MIRVDRPNVTLERTFRASIEEVWELWTTREGIEAWWAPDGHRLTVRELDVRPGGEFVGEMTATSPGQVEWQTRAGIPLTTIQRIVYTEVEPPHRLRYRNLIDFVPGVEEYELESLIEFEETSSGVRVVVTFSALHNDEWSRLARLGYESQLGHLEAVLESRR